MVNWEMKFLTISSERIKIQNKNINNGMAAGILSWYDLCQKNYSNYSLATATFNPCNAETGVSCNHHTALEAKK